MKQSWTLKYMPKTLSSIIGNDQIISRFKQMVDDKMIPNMIITGSSGVGKTLSIRCLVNEYKQRNNAFIGKINGSEIRSVDIIKSKIIILGQKKMKNNEQRIFIVDEADSIQISIQHTIRRLIEDFEKKISFIFICNNLCKIIEPMQSRCTIYNFSRLRDTQILYMLTHLCIS